uniref:ATP-dependent DNA helicase n=1 Tax=Saccoglossus kowalevskii TaxID=10224 RepID=A0ABM0MHP0_SACKO
AECQLKPKQFHSFEEFYQTGAVKYKNNWPERVKSIVDRNKAMFEKDVDVIDAAEQMLESCSILEDAWAQIHPESEKERLECLESASTNSIANESESEDSIPDLLHKDKKDVCKEVYNQCGMSKNEAKILMRSLNDKQRDIFYTVRQWCLDKANGKNVAPFHMFLSGGAGTGKSHVIKAVYYEASRILARILPNPDDISVLLTAPTGVAAFNINATTVHSTFSIAVDAKLPYQPLGQDTLTTIRSKLSSLQILIIDEISMVDKKLLCYIHGRLRQIKQTGDYSPFGNVSVIAVGDFYQLPPVKGKALYVSSEGMDLWNDYFAIAELTDVVRQQDQQFAEALNIVRTRRKSDDLPSNVINIFRQCETGEEYNGMHIFATNKDVDLCNINMLHATCSDLICINAQDFSRNTKTKKLEQRQRNYVKVYNTNLAKTVTLAINARVMLIKNIDVSDGLVNGVFGKISHITSEDNESFPSCIYVVFDNVKVGAKLR